MRIIYISLVPQLQQLVKEYRRLGALFLVSYYQPFIISSVGGREFLPFSNSVSLHQSCIIGSHCTGTNIYLPGAIARKSFHSDTVCLSHDSK